MRAPQTGRWMRRKAQTEGCIAAWRRRYPEKPGRALSRIRRGRCWHRPATPAIPQTPSGGRNRPPYKAAGSGRQRTNVSHPPSPPAGRCNHRPLRRGRSGRSAREAARRRGTVCRPPFRRPSALHCRAGVHARRGGLRRPGRVLARQGAAPLSRLTPTAPLAGEPFRRQFPKASPARGCGVERRLRRRKLFLMRQTAVTPFIIACSAIENIRPPFAHRSGLYRFAVMQRSQSTSVLQRAPCDAGTANRTVDAPQGADGRVHCRLAAEIS